MYVFHINISRTEEAIFLVTLLNREEEEEEVEEEEVNHPDKGTGEHSTFMLSVVNIQK